MKQADLRTFPKTKSRGECWKCGNFVPSYQGYKTFVGEDGTVIMHVPCYVSHVSKILRRIGAMKD